MSAPRILIVDDELPLAHAMSLKLSHAGYTVTVANDGEEALGILEQEPFDLVLLDIVMPHVNGFEVLTRMKNLSLKGADKVIIMSNLGQEEDLKRAKELGAADYLVKSDTPLVEMVSYVQKMLGAVATPAVSTPEVSLTNSNISLSV